jgi:hypothetical protein
MGISPDSSPAWCPGIGPYCLDLRQPLWTARVQSLRETLTGLEHAITHGQSSMAGRGRSQLYSRPPADRWPRISLDDQENSWLLLSLRPTSTVAPV